jgi:AcrR family transcriptional regulator
VGELKEPEEESMGSSNEDPRAVRTRQAIGQAAAALLSTDGWEALTVAQLCKRAQVARSTFYEHYREPWEPVFALLVARFYEQFPEYGGEELLLDPTTLLASGRPLSYPIFAHVEANIDLYRRAFEDPRGAPLVRAFESAVAEVSRRQHAALRRLSSARVDEELTAAFLAGAAVASARVWVLREHRQSAVSLAYWFSQIAAPGLLGIMGLGELLEG